MTERELLEIKKNNDQISKLKRRYNELKDGSETKGQEITGMPHVSGISDRTCTMVESLVDIEIQIKKLQDSNRELKRRALEWIEDIPDDVIQAVFVLKYIGCMDSGTIAQELDMREPECSVIPFIFFKSVL